MEPAQENNSRYRGYGCRRSLAGITLIELMIVVVILGILAAIAYPSYRSYSVKGNRKAAQSFMLSVASRQEQMMLDQRRYVPAANHAAIAADLRMTVPNEVSRFYTISATAFNASTPPGFSVTATPLAGTAQAGDPVLSLGSDGTRAPADLWK